MADGKLFTGNDRFCRVVAPAHHLSLAEAGLCKWPQRIITYHESLTLNAPGLDIRAVYDLAWQQWADVCNIAPARLPTAGGANVAAGQGAIDGPWGTLAYSYLPCGASSTTQLTQLYDDGETWSHAFLLACACHEIGHALGLNHLDVGNLMAPILDENITKPQPGDIEEIQARYGPPAVVPTLVPTPEPMPTPEPNPPPVPTSINLPLDGLYHSYVVAPGGEERYPFHVPGAWYRPRKWFEVDVKPSFVVALYGHLGKQLARVNGGLRMKLYAGDYSIGVQDLSNRGGPFLMAAKLG